MKKLLIGILILASAQSYAATMAKCSVTNRTQEVSGINLLINNDATSSYLFFRTSGKIRLEGKSSIATRVENSFYGNDINRPAGQSRVKILTSSISDSQYKAKIELRLQSGLSNSRVSGRLTVLDRGEIITNYQNIFCDITNQ